MEYLGRGELSRYVTNGISEAEIKEIAEHILRGLEVMHREGFTHRDIKPENILVVQKRPEFQRWWVKIADFGISKQVPADSGTALHTFIGTRSYCAPEVLFHTAQNVITYTNKVDMWSFGCVLFNLGSCGELPFSERELLRYCDGNVQFNPRSIRLYLGDDGKLFSKDLLRVEPNQRPTAVEALRCSWLGISQRLSSDANTNRSRPHEIHRTPQDNVCIARSEMRRWLRDNEENLQWWEKRSDQAPLFVAVQQGRLDVIERLISEHADVNARDEEGTTPLHVAVVNGMLKVAERLFQQGADVSAMNYGRSTPLHFAVGQGELEVVEWLVEHGADINAKNKMGWTPLHVTASIDKPQIAESLIRHRADINAKAQDGYTPLHTAALYGSLEVAICLVKHGADINVKDKDGITPLYYAILRDKLKVAESLAKHGADINGKVLNGCTPLYVAAHFGKLKMVKLLVKHGAKINAKDDDGVTPRQVAESCSHTEVATWLKEQEAAQRRSTREEIRIPIRSGRRR